MKKRIIQYFYVEEVTIRAFVPDKIGIATLLREHKSLTNQQIAKELSLPVTKVEHWFRTDNGFAVPDPKKWVQIKELLNIDNNDFDEQITMFDTKNAVYEKAGRVYGNKGLSATIVTTSDIKVIRKYENDNSTKGQAFKSKENRIR